MKIVPPSTVTARQTLSLGGGLSLPVDVVTETLAILGLRGSGKTNTATVIAEGLLSLGQQVVIIDPTDAWWGLKSSADGTADGYPVVVIGGRHGDIPLDAQHGALCADFVVDHRASVICSLRHFESRADQRRFVTDFCNRLYHRKGETGHDTPLMLMIDEASLFVPQRVMGEDARMVAAIQRLVRQGRSSGFGVTLIDQRASTVNKDVLTQVDCLVVHRTTAPQDRKALDAWIEQHDAHDQRSTFLASLASLPRGTAWVWSPGWLDVFEKVAIRARATFDSSRTPKPGERVTAPTQVAAVDLEALRTAFAATIAQAEADDPKVLRRRIAELERAARSVDVGEIERAHTRGRDTGRLEENRRLRHRVVELEGVLGLIEGAIVRGRQAIRALEESVAPLANDGGEVGVGETYPDFSAASMPDAASRLESDSLAWHAVQPLNGGTTAAHGAGSVVDVKVYAQPPRSPRPPRDHAGRSQLGSTPAKMLDAMALLAQLGIPEPSRVNVAGFVGISANTGTFRNYLSELRSAGAIEDRPGLRLALTAKGRAVAQVPPLLPTLAELHATWASKLGGTTAKMLYALVKAHPKPMTRAQLAHAVGIDHTTGTFRNYLSELRSPGLLVDVSRDTVKAGEILFPPGLR